MAELQTMTIRTLGEFTNFVYGLTRDAKDIHWYRGCEKAGHALLPGLYRHPLKTTVGELLDLEKEMLAWFTLRSVPYLTRELPLPWDRLFMMQHYRMPTRLLDWTENPFIALYFALRGSDSEPDAGEGSTGDSAAVWILRPDHWNAMVFQRTAQKPFLFSPGDEGDPDGLLDGYEPGKEVPSDLPVAIYGSYSNPRIVAQRGTFVVFGRDTRPMEKLFEAEKFPDGVLAKLEMPKETKSEVLRSLLAIGITDSVIFPDLEGLAMEARRRFGFEV